MPELPEVEIVCRRLSEAVVGSTVRSVQQRAINTVKSFSPPIGALVDSEIGGIHRRGKRIIIDFSNEMTLIIHLMSAGRLQLFDKPGSMRDRTIRFLIAMKDGRELRLREFGTRQSSWVKLVETPVLADELGTLGPEAWPDPPDLKALLTEPRPLHGMLRDQHVVAGIGRSWIDEILHHSRLSPFKRADSLTGEEAERLRESIIDVLGSAIAHYEERVTVPIPDKFPMPLKVHARKGQSCPRCGDDLEAVHFEGYEMCYCPTCQTEGKHLKDRRLSRLLK